MAGRTKTATAELRTKPTAASVESFLAEVDLACLGQLLTAAAADLATAAPAAPGADPSGGTGTGGASTR